MRHAESMVGSQWNILRVIIRTPRMTSLFFSDMLFLKHDGRIFGHSLNPVCGFSMMEQVRLCAVWPMENWLGTSLNQIRGWSSVRESYSRRLEQGLLALLIITVTLFLQVTKRQTMRTVKTTPHATPVTMTTTEEEGEANIDPDSVDLDPVTAFESVTPGIYEYQKIVFRNVNVDRLFQNNRPILSKTTKK